MYTWEISKMVQNPFNEDHKKPTDPEALYSYTIRRKGTNWVLGSGIKYADVKLLMKHFGVDTAAELVGKEFTNGRELPSSALNLLLIQIRNEGNYAPATPEDLRHQAAVALANFEEPDYSHADDESIFEAFHEVWDGFRANEAWLTAFKAKIAELSEGRVSLEDADSNDFSVRVKGPANYLRLQRDGETKLVIIGPYASPVEFAY